MPLTNKDIETKAIELVKGERQAWEDATCFITEKVAFRMRNLIRTLRKNYWGVFDEIADPITGREKTWVPLTEMFVEWCVKNFDLDLKDVQVRTENPKLVGFVFIVRSILRKFLEKIGFGEELDLLEREIAIDGTKVWKTIKTKDENGRETAKVIPVDLLNCYLDPTSKSIAEAYRFTERGLLTASEIKGMTDWINTKEIEGTIGLSKTDAQMKNYTQTSPSTPAKYVDVWEMWGKIPEYLITGDSEDKDEVEGRVVVSGLESGSERVHLIEQIKDNKKPYEEAWYKRVPGRWFGRGPAEMVMMLQIWINIIVNIRITRSLVSQLGIFKIRKGSGITPQMLSKLAVQGAIVVNNQDDLQQLVMQEASQASYQDESNIEEWGRKITSAFETVTGETLPSTATATAVAAQSRSATSQFVLIREGVGMFLQRWLKNQIMPILSKRMRPSDILTITGDVEEMREFDERLVLELASRELQKAEKEGRWFRPEEVMREIQDARDRLQKMGSDRYAQLAESIDFEMFDPIVYVTNEEMDKGTMVTNLVSALQVVQDPQQREQILIQMFDLLGLPPYKTRPAAPQLAQPAMIQRKQNIPLPQPAEMQTVAMPAKIA